MVDKLSSPGSAGADAGPRVDLHELAARAGALDGHVRLCVFQRLAQSLAGPLEELQAQWRLEGFTRVMPGGALQPMARLAVAADVPMQCQRCLQPALQRIEDSVLFRLVDVEPALTLEELEAEDEALCVEGAVDVHAFVEDQLILALPLVPVHAVCPQPLDGGDDASHDAPRESPFAALAKLRQSR